MKTIVSLLSLLCLFCILCWAQSESVLSIKTNNRSLTELIEEIEAKTDLNFAYSLDLINKHYTDCQCNISDQPVQQALTNLLQNSQIEYEISERQVTLFYNKKKSILSGFH